ncbi:transposase [Methylovirgula sp. HY1]|uniref:transposase n=1 Tax=Methylovirgula sp. HY1 TaxID=2822761 RepID=UPI0021065AA8|nr:transposase [Methylovirgula sp. HY1]
MSKAIVVAKPLSENAVLDVRQLRRRPPISPTPISLIDAPRQSTSKNSCARQSTPRISTSPRHQILIQIVARLSSRSSRYSEGRTLPFVFKSEAESLSTIEARVDAGAIVHADEATHWDRLHGLYLTKRINHEWSYSDEGACTNQAESFFSRLRRAEIGTHHHIAGPYLTAYSREMAWRENNRRVSNGEQYLMAASAALGHPVSRQWKGYWQKQLS